MNNLSQIIKQHVNDAIRLHLQWKDHLDSVLLSKSSHISVEDAADCSLCPLGRWLNQLALNCYPSKAESIDDIIRLHGRFHLQASKVLESDLLPHSQGTELHGDLLLEYEIASRELLTALSLWNLAEPSQED